MSDSEEENYCFFGKPLEPYDEDAFPKKKPISVEDQVATDAQGRRRFHGAFTGGFSAGFYNTVGSLEGWTPSEFISTRQEKALNKKQKVEDFMDDEDIGEFGIAPQTVRATSDYSTSKKRKKQVFSDGPIPGEPVLHSLLTSGNETIGYLLLKNIGLKDRTKAQEDEDKSESRVYGCEMPKTYEISRADDFNQYDIPGIYLEYLKNPKDNSFGFGYVGLDKSHVNLFQSSKLVIKERNKKKISISGQAFGVGAFEDDDEDIYVKDDMSRYDFELTGEKASKKDDPKNKEKTVFDDFIPSKTALAPKEIFSPPTIPHSFTGKHKQKRSRFEPLPDAEKIPERQNMNSEVRARYLGEETSSETLAAHAQPTTSAPAHKNENVETPTSDVKEEPKSNFELFSVSATSLVFDRFVSATKVEDPLNILEVVEKSETEHGTQEMRDAARMKMFGPLTRISTDWQPNSLLCKRFNVPEPHCDELNASKNRKRTKNLIFEYEKFSDISAADFKPGLSTKEPEKIEENLNATQDISAGENSSRIEETTENKNEEAEKRDTSAEEETPKDITDKIDLNKNLDLFRAVFLSSSESEDEEETEKEKTEKTTEMKSTVLSDSLLPKITILSDTLLPKITILSDTLLPKIIPIKEGILSNMDFSIFDKPSDDKNNENISKEEESKDYDVEMKDDLSYGPALPIRISTCARPSSTLLSTAGNVSTQNDDDEWVEKSGKKNKSHKKKHKNKKSSHKKKHKHKER